MDNSTCNKYSNFKCNKKTPYIFNNIDNIIAIGDIHGDIQLLINIFLHTDTLRLINGQNKNNEPHIEINNKLYQIIKKNNCVIVQVGDQLDSYRPKRNNVIRANNENELLKQLNVNNMKINKFNINNKIIQNSLEIDLKKNQIQEMRKNKQEKNKQEKNNCSIKLDDKIYNEHINILQNDITILKNDNEKLMNSLLRKEDIKQVKDEKKIIFQENLKNGVNEYSDRYIFLIMSELFLKINKHYYHNNYHIVSLIGNHEIMNLTNNYRYALKDYKIIIYNDYSYMDDNLKAKYIDRYKYFIKNNINDSIFCHRAFSIYVNNKFLFSHSGLITQDLKNIFEPKEYMIFLSDKTSSFDKIKLYNNACLSYLYDSVNNFNKQFKMNNNNLFKIPEKKQQDYDLVIYNHVGNREYTYKEYDEIQENNVCNTLKKTKDIFKLDNLDNMIIGHNISEIGDIKELNCDNAEATLTSIDVGASKIFNIKKPLPVALIFKINNYDNSYVTTPVIRS